jgi:hypothetical protein
VTEDPIEDEPNPKRRKVTRKAKIRLAVALVLGLGATGAWVYVRYLVPKSALGGPCRWAMHCGKEAPACMRPDIDRDGVCSKPCDADAGDCASGIRCVTIEVEERDERGMPLKGGYCFPQTFLDAKKNRPREAGAPIDSWLDVPESAAQLEGEIAYAWERGGAPSSERAFLIKGSLLREVGRAGDGRPASGTSRTIVDTSSLRVFAVDDAKRTFAPSTLDPPGGDAKTDKTGKKDKVLGRDCEIWQIDDGRARREACVLLGAAFVDPAARGVPAWIHELSARGALPLRVVETDKGGKEVSRMTATRFDVRPVDASLFTIPHAYRNLAGR